MDNLSLLVKQVEEASGKEVKKEEQKEHKEQPVKQMHLTVAHGEVKFAPKQRNTAPVLNDSDIEEACLVLRPLPTSYSNTSNSEGPLQRLSAHLSSSSNPAESNKHTQFLPFRALQEGKSHKSLQNFRHSQAFVNACLLSHYRDCYMPHKHVRNLETEMPKAANGLRWPDDAV